MERGGGRGFQKQAFPRVLGRLPPLAVFSPPIIFDGQGLLFPPHFRWAKPVFLPQSGSLSFSVSRPGQVFPEALSLLDLKRVGRWPTGDLVLTNSGLAVCGQAGIWSAERVAERVAGGRGAELGDGVLCFGAFGANGKARQTLVFLARIKHSSKSLTWYVVARSARLPGRAKQGRRPIFQKTHPKSSAGTHIARNSPPSHCRPQSCHIRAIWKTASRLWGCYSSRANLLVFLIA